MSRFRTNCDERKPFTGITFIEPSRTKQSELEASDINNIMSRYALEGILPSNIHDPNTALYGDFTEVHDYQTNLAAVQEAEDKFNSLPSELRRKFDYSPQNMIDFIMNPDNKEECVKYGFINKPLVEASQVASVEPSNNLPPVDSSING